MVMFPQAGRQLERHGRQIRPPHAVTHVLKHHEFLFVSNHIGFITQKSVYLRVMKRVLIITYYWPPTGGSGVQRWVKFAKYLPAEGWQPVIYTPENPEQLAIDETLAKEVPADTEILKTHITEPYELYKKFLKKQFTQGT